MAKRRCTSRQSAFAVLISTQPSSNPLNHSRCSPSLTHSFVKLLTQAACLPAASIRLPRLTHSPASSRYLPLTRPKFACLLACIIHAPMHSPTHTRADTRPPTLTPPLPHYRPCTHLHTRARTPAHQHQHRHYPTTAAAAATPTRYKNAASLATFLLAGGDPDKPDKHGKNT
jgi:hypothetical protein